jgi:hypothetical protein
MQAFAPATFAEALLDAERPVPPGIAASTQQMAQWRFAVYRNNVVVSLIDALRARFPACEKIVGEEFFVAMARVFVSRHPPANPLMMWFGDALPEFIESFQPAAEVPYLADVARIEAARTRAYHARDVTPLNATAFSTCVAAHGDGSVFAVHPSAHVVRSSYPAVTIWAMNSGTAELAPIDDWRSEDALVARPLMDVEVRWLPAGAAALLSAIGNGHTLAKAAEHAALEAPSFDLAAAIVAIVGAGVLIERASSVPTKGEQP